MGGTAEPKYRVKVLVLLCGQVIGLAGRLASKRKRKPGIKLAPHAGVQPLEAGSLVTRAYAIEMGSYVSCDEGMTGWKIAGTAAEVMIDWRGGGLKPPFCPSCGRKKQLAEKVSECGRRAARDSGWRGCKTSNEAVEARG